MPKKRKVQSYESGSVMHDLAKKEKRSQTEVGEALGTIGKKRKDKKQENWS